MRETDLVEIKRMLSDLVASKNSGEPWSNNITPSNLRDLEIMLRRMRNKAFPIGYFSDFAWDILLGLDRARRLGQRYVVTDAGAEAGIPLTTTVRYIAKMERDGYIERETDPQDRRRTFVSLTQLGTDALDTVFEDATSNQASLQIGQPKHLI